MQLATSLQPRNLQCETWFRICAEALQRYQQESLVEEEERRQEQRKGYLKELEKEISDLNQANVGSDSKDFLKHIYATYPPKNSNCSLDLSQYPKKLLLKAILHYHPDKQDREVHGEKWAVLCEEIVKLLTPRYELYKCDPTTSTTDENIKTEPEEEDVSEETEEEDETEAELVSEEEDEQPTEQDQRQSTTSQDEERTTPEPEEVLTEASIAD